MRASRAPSRDNPTKSMRCRTPTGGSGGGCVVVRASPIPRLRVTYLVLGSLTNEALACVGKRHP